MIRRAHVEHRRMAFANVDWPADALARLLDQQHGLQEHHIATYHPRAERRMILVRGAAVGRLCVDRTDTRCWRIVDLALLGEVQGRGIGGTVLTRLFEEADRAGAAIELQVGRDNPRAEALYRRIGFVDAIGSSDTHRRLVRPAVS